MSPAAVRGPTTPAIVRPVRNPNFTLNSQIPHTGAGARPVFQARPNCLVWNMVPALGHVRRERPFLVNFMFQGQCRFRAGSKLCHHRHPVNRHLQLIDSQRKDKKPFGQKAEGFLFSQLIISLLQQLELAKTAEAKTGNGRSQYRQASQYQQRPKPLFTLQVRPLVQVHCAPASSWQP